VDLEERNHYAFSMPRIHHILFSLALITLAVSVNAESRLVRDEAGIIVNELVDPGRTLPILTATTTMKTTTIQLAAWIGAVHTYTQWQHNCAEAYVINQSDENLLIYNRVASPWPVADRDVVLQSIVTRKPDDSIVIKFFNRDDTATKLPKGVVRMPHLSGKYELTPIAEGTHVIYTIDSDPGGKLPAWLVRRASKDLPFFTLKNLRALAEAGPPPTEK